MEFTLSISVLKAIRDLRHNKFTHSFLETALAEDLPVLPLLGAEKVNENTPSCLQGAFNAQMDRLPHRNCECKRPQQTRNPETAVLWQWVCKA